MTFSAHINHLTLIPPLCFLINPAFAPHRMTLKEALHGKSQSLRIDFVQQVGSLNLLHNFFCPDTIIRDKRVLKIRTQLIANFTVLFKKMTFESLGKLTLQLVFVVYHAVFRIKFAVVNQNAAFIHLEKINLNRSRFTVERYPASMSEYKCITVVIRQAKMFLLASTKRVHGRRPALFPPPMCIPSWGRRNDQKLPTHTPTSFASGRLCMRKNSAIWQLVVKLCRVDNPKLEVV